MAYVCANPDCRDHRLLAPPDDSALEVLVTESMRRQTWPETPLGMSPRLVETKRQVVRWPYRSRSGAVYYLCAACHAAVRLVQETPL